LADALELTPSSPGIDWNKASLEDLLGHIESVHHRFLREEKPRLIALAHKVAAVHGDRHPELVELESAVDLIFRELDPHLDREEQVEFPAIRNWEKAGREGAGSGLPGHLEALEDEHVEVGRILENIRDLTSGFRPPPDACNSYLALFHGLEQLEADLHAHIHKENNILHARIRAAAAPKATNEGCSFCGE
jgi:regulator of cell morphogenesis and NO signaling